MPKNKKIMFIIIGVVVLISLALGGYFLWGNLRKSASSQKIKTIENAGEATEKITDSATKGVLPSIQTNPLEDKPDVNPASKTNPYKNIIINPF